MNVLGIETSCDETASAVFDGNRILSNVISTQTIHEEYGGVVPELASREHLTNLIPVVDSALARAQVTWREIHGIAVTKGPGLAGSLLVGISYAKAVAYSRSIPLIGVNHIEGHLWAPSLENDRLKPPFLGLIISGGHTQLWLVRKFGEYRLLGQTLDDAVGEAFDKVAQMLGLEYPGGPAIDRLSAQGNPGFKKFPRPALKTERPDFSFSGLKTSVLYFLESLGEEKILAHREDIAASFQRAVVDTLIYKTVRTAKKVNVGKIVLGGGVAANSELKSRLSDQANREGLEVYIPPPKLCTDNAAMIAYVGYRRMRNNESTDFSFSASPSLKLPETVQNPEVVL
ncbi:tRNA (adenosine(37)-N6)-threonylcarbamoyltransferase complex transferase subunit TsaD [candidate division KSB1 bacterium]